MHVDIHALLGEVLWIHLGVFQASITESAHKCSVTADCVDAKGIVFSVV